MKYVILFIGLVIGCWGVWYLSTDAGMQAAKMSLEVCGKLNANTVSQIDALRCSADVWKSYDDGKNRAIWGLVIGVILTIAGLTAIRAKPHTD